MSLTKTGGLTSMSNWFLHCNQFIFAGFMVGPMVRKHGCRVVMIFGTFLASVGYCASAFVQNLPTLCFTLGFLVGKIILEICLSVCRIRGCFQIVLHRSAFNVTLSNQVTTIDNLDVGLRKYWGPYSRKQTLKHPLTLIKRKNQWASQGSNGQAENFIKIPI